MLPSTLVHLPWCTNNCPSLAASRQDIRKSLQSDAPSFPSALDELANISGAPSFSPTFTRAHSESFIPLLNSIMSPTISKNPSFLGSSRSNVVPGSREPPPCVCANSCRTLTLSAYAPNASSTERKSYFDNGASNSNNPCCTATPTAATSASAPTPSVVVWVLASFAP